MSLGPDARAILDLAAHEDDPSESDAARVRAKIAARIAMSAAIGTAATLTTKSAAAGTTSVAPAALGGSALAGTTAASGASVVASGTSVGAKLLLAAVMASGAATSVMVVAPRRAPAPEALSTKPTASATVAPRVDVTKAPSTASGTPFVAPALPIGPASADPPREAPTPVSAIASAKRAGAPSTRLAGPPPITDAVTEEATILHAAHAALARGDGNAALAHLDEHARRFPRGALGEEETAARVLSLCAAGRVGEARALGASFLATSPRSPVASQVKRSCASRP